MDRARLRNDARERAEIDPQRAQANGDCLRRRESRAILKREIQQNTKTPRTDEWHSIVRRRIKRPWIRNQTADAGRSGPPRTPRKDQEEIQSQHLSLLRPFVSPCL